MIEVLKIKDSYLVKGLSGKFVVNGEEFPRPKVNKYFKVIVSGENAMNVSHPEFPADFRLEEAIRCIDCPYYGVWTEPPHKRIVLVEEKDLIRLHGEGWKNFVYGV